MLINHIKNQHNLSFKNSEYAKKKINKKINKFKFIDLFAGIGGFRLGFSNSISQCVFSSEWDKYAAKTYEENFNEKPFGDINDISVNDIPDFDILLGGFPCQPFSKIGLREGFKHKTQGSLFFNIAKIIEKKNPSCFVLENVTGLLTHRTNKKLTIDEITDVLTDLNYEVHLGMLDSSEFGVPQIRKRVYIVGFNKKLFAEQTSFKFPKGKNKKKYMNDIIEIDAKGYGISKHLQKSYIFKFNDNKPQIIDNKSKEFAKTLCSSYHKIQRLTGTFVKDGNTGLRLLTENECKELMGFPRKFKFPVSRTQMYRQLGNAVVVPVIKEISKEIFEVLQTVYKIK